MDIFATILESELAGLFDVAESFDSGNIASTLQWEAIELLQSVEYGHFDLMTAFTLWIGRN